MRNIILKRIYLVVLATLFLNYGLATVTIHTDPVDLTQAGPAQMSDLENLRHPYPTDDQHKRDPNKYPPAGHCPNTDCVPTFLGLYAGAAIPHPRETRNFATPAQLSLVQKTLLDRDPPVPRSLG